MDPSESDRERERRIQELPGPAAWKQGVLIVVDRAAGGDGSIVRVSGIPDDEQYVVRCAAANPVARAWAERAFSERDGGVSYLVFEPPGGPAYLQTNDPYLRDAVFQPSFAAIWAEKKAEMTASGEAVLQEVSGSKDPRDADALRLVSIGSMWRIRRSALRSRFPEIAGCLGSEADYRKVFLRRSEMGGTEIQVPRRFWVEHALSQQSK